MTITTCDVAAPSPLLIVSYIVTRTTMICKSKYKNVKVEMYLVFRNSVHLEINSFRHINELNLSKSKNHIKMTKS
jgi:hypothetical protein